MKQYLSLILSILFYVSANAQDIKTISMGGTQASGYTIVLPCDYVNRPIVNITIAGKNYRFLFDTGSPTCISQKIIDRIQPQILGHVRAGSSEIPVYTVPEITLDEIAFNDIPAMRFSTDGMNEFLGLDGIIGSNLLRNSIVSFSLPERTITITDNPETLGLKREHAIDMILTPEQSFPIVKTAVIDQGTANIELLFASAFSGLYDIALRHFFHFKENNVFSNFTETQSNGTPGNTPHYQLKVPTLKVAASEIKDVTIQTIPDDNSRMGAGLFALGTVTLDYRNKLFYFEPFPLKKVDFSTFNLGGSKASDYEIVLPCEFGGLPIVTVSINGKEYSFLFDTGAITGISQKIVDEIQPRALTKIELNDSENRRDSLPVYSLPEVTLGGVAFNDIPAFLFKESEIKECLNLDGIIGSNLLHNSVVRFSSEKKTISITNNPENFQLKKENATEMIVTPDQGSPILKTTLIDRGTANVELLFDSGFTGVYALAIRHLYLFKEHDIFSLIEKGWGASSYTFFGRADETLQYRLRVPELKIGNLQLKNTLIESTMDDNSRVGAALFQFGDITLDFRNRLFYFEQYSGKDTNLYKKCLPVTVSPSDGKFIIGILWNDKLKDKISVGDEVLSIEKVNLEGLDKCKAFLAGLDFSAKDSFLFTIKDKDGNIKEVRIDKE
ncbi:MAG: retropepsin-like aspartic protease [Dysgonomonas sp.]